MLELTYEYMEQMIQNGYIAHQYAWDHYEELNSRICVRTLYGPPSPYLGILAAGHLTPAKDRTIMKNTKRKKYLRYELDENNQIIRIREMKNYSVVNCTHHIFQLNGVTYARSFFEERKIPYNDRTFAIRYDNGRPCSFAITQKNYLCMDFYEYPQQDIVRTTCYLYLQGWETTRPEYRRSRDVPMGTAGSPVVIETFEETYQHFDFLDLK